jgi:hypothetical protein
MRSLGSASLAVALSVSVVSAQIFPQTPWQAASPKSSHRVNELRLAGLRPGRDTISRAHHLYHKPYEFDDTGGRDGEIWLDYCYHLMLVVDFDSAKKIQTVRVGEGIGVGDCFLEKQSPWKTGAGLHVHESTDRVIALYGQPDSRSPSTKGGQQLELLYYAFDWAGPDVPQVMEVLCTPEKDGKPGRVVEITLAGPSL